MSFLSSQSTSSQTPTPTFDSFNSFNASLFPSYGSPAPTGNSTNDSTNSTGISTSTSLHLYTLLTTLALLGICSAIFIRSLLLRRAHRRMIENGIRNGTWAPSPTSTRGHNIYAQNPRMFEAWFPKDSNETSDGNKERSSSRRGLGKMISHSKEEQEWDDIMPFSAMYINSSAADHPLSVSQPQSQHDTPALISFAHIWRWRPSLSLSPTATLPGLPLINSNDFAAPQPIQPATQPTTVRVAFLIAMPPQIETSQHVYDDGQLLSRMVFGVADVEVVPRECDGEGRKASIGSGRESADGEREGV